MLYIAPSIILAASLGSLDCPVFLWDNLVPASGISADEENASYPASNLANPQTSSLWKATTTGDQDIVIDVISDEAINAIGLARHNFGSGEIGLGIYGKTAEPGADWVQLADLTPGDDAPIFAIVDGDYYTQIKLSLTPDATVPQAAVCYMGTALILPRSTPAGYVLLKDGLERDMLNGYAENGDFLGDVVISQKLATSIEIKLLDGDWYRAHMRPFVQSSAPFFYARSSATMPSEVGYCKFDGTPKGQVNQFTGEVDVSMSVKGLAL